MTEEIAQNIKDGTLQVFCSVKAPDFYATSTIYYYPRPVNMGPIHENVDHKSLKRPVSAQLDGSSQNFDHTSPKRPFSAQLDGSRHVNVDRQSLKRKYIKIAAEIPGGGAPSQTLVESQQQDCSTKKSQQQDCSTKTSQQQDCSAKTSQQQDCSAKTTQKQDCSTKTSQQKDCSAKTKQQQDSSAKTSQQQDCSAKTTQKQDCSTKTSQQKDCSAKTKQQQDSSAKTTQQQDSSAKTTQQKDCSAKKSQQQDCSAKTTQQQECSVKITQPDFRAKTSQQEECRFKSSQQQECSVKTRTSQQQDCSGQSLQQQECSVKTKTSQQQDCSGQSLQQQDCSVKTKTSQQQDYSAKTHGEGFISEEVKPKRAKLNAVPPEELSEIEVNPRNLDKSTEKKKNKEIIHGQSLIPLKAKNLNNGTESTAFVAAVHEKSKKNQPNQKAVMNEPGKKTCYKRMKILRKNIKIACKETYLAALKKEQDILLKPLRQLANRLVNTESSTSKPLELIRKIAKLENVPICWEKSGHTQTSIYSGHIRLALVNCISKDARFKVTCMALEKLLLPKFHRTQIGPDLFEFHSSGQMPLICKDDTSLILMPPPEHNNPQTKCNPTEFSELSKLIICIESASEPVFNVLKNSAKSCNMDMESQVKKEGDMFHVTLKFGACVIAEGSGRKFFEARENASVEAITKLKTVCWAILRKPEVGCCQYFSKTWLEQQVMSENNGCDTIQEKSGSGVGFEDCNSNKPVAGSKVPQAGSQAIKHTAAPDDNLLPSQDNTSTRIDSGTKTVSTTNFRDLARAFVKGFSNKVNQDDIVLSSKEFFKSDLQMIQDECKPYKNIRVGKGKKGLTLSKIRTVHELFECLNLNGGEMLRFRLVPPSSTNESFLDDVGIKKVSCKTLSIQPLPETSNEFKTRLDNILEKFKQSITLNKIIIPIELKSEAKTVHCLGGKHRLIVKGKIKKYAFIVRKPRGRELKI